MSLSIWKSAPSVDGDALGSEPAEHPASAAVRAMAVAVTAAVRRILTP
jgi:hypothetical protein